MKIAHFGTFDVDNYGDLLFPHIARYRLVEHDWIHISPTNSKTSFTDSLPVLSYRQSLKEKFDAVIIGGGNIIHIGNTSLVNYTNIAEFAYPYLWIGAANLANKQKIPLVFNAPGIMSTYKGIIEKELFKIVFSYASYLNFRDNESANIASSLVNKNIDVVPDSAFDIAEMWPIHDISNGNYIVVNLNQRYHEPVKLTAQYLEKIRDRLNQPLKLIIIGACHGDLEFASLVQNEIKEKPELVPTTSIKDLALLIANSSFFLGSSLHGFITALSYGTPALLVLKNKPIRKFEGVTQLLNLSEDTICHSWEEAIEKLSSPVLLTEIIRNEIKNKLNSHWRKIAECIMLGRDASKHYLILPHWETLLKMNRKYIQAKRILRKKLIH